MSWTTPAAAPAGDALTATFWDAQVKGNLDVIGGAWTAFTSTVTGWTLGNGTVTAAYKATGKTITVRVKVTVGSTTVTAVGLALTLPVATHADWASAERWVARDVSAVASYFGDADILGASTAFNCRATTPFTWATGDYIGLEFEYESA